MIKKITAFCVIIFTVISLTAQQRGFSDDPNLTLEEMKAYLEQQSPKDKQKEVKALMNDFTAFWTTAKPEAKTVFLEAANALAKKRVTIFPDFEAFIVANKSFASSPYASQVEAWKQTVLYFVKNGKDFTKIFTNYKNLFERSVLNENSSITWASENGSFKLGFDEEPVVIFTGVNLYGKTVGDSIAILNTGGNYYIRQELFKGKQGKITWERAGLGPEVYALFDNFEVNVSLQVIRIENVTFHNPRYFSKPLKGYLTDRATPNNTPDKSRFPHFFSYDKNIKIPNFYKDVDFVGGFELSGNTVLGSGDENSFAKFIFNKNQKKAIEISARHFSTKNRKISTEDSRVAIFFENDSITHISVNVTYNDSTRRLLIARSLESLGKSPFFNSYHAMDIMVEALTWNIDSNSIFFGTVLGATNGIPGVFESQNYFDNSIMRRFESLNGESSLIPLQKMFRENKFEPLTIKDLAKKYRTTEADIIAIIIRAANFGFVEFDPMTRMVAYRNKLGFYISALGGKTDYDIIQFESNAKSDYARLNLLTNELKIYDVSGVGLSDAKMVNFNPAKGELTVNKNRDMLFSGKVISGLYDIYGQDFRFSYDAFKIEFQNIDSMVIHVEDKAKGRDERGEYFLSKVNNYIYGINGLVLIDEPNNKSGVKQTKKFPYFESYKDGYVFYPRPFLHDNIRYNHAYPKETFYYVVQPFKIEDMLTNDVKTVSFNGYLKSADIFPDIRQPLVIRTEDFSLGFVYQTDAGLPVYRGLGQYYQTIDLSNQGLRGAGKLSYKQARMESDNFLFLPDSMITRGKSYEILEDRNSDVQTPELYAKNPHIRWMPYADSMLVRAKNDTMQVFSKDIVFKGELLYRSQGVFGNGILCFKNAEISSKKFLFKHHELLADTSNLLLRDRNTLATLFEVNDYKSHLNFETFLGKFEITKHDSKVNFEANHYATVCPTFEWLMNDDEINLDWGKENQTANINALASRELYTMKGKAGSDMVSTHPDQGGLSFKAGKANYSFRTNIIKLESIRFIHVADVIIIPNNGTATISPNAVLSNFENCRILGDTLSQKYDFYDATASITAKSQFTGSGYYDFIDENKKIQTLKLDDIHVLTGNTRGISHIHSNRSFTISPHFGFQGDMTIVVKDTLIHYDGLVEIQHSCSINKQKIFAKQRIDQNDISILIDKNAKGENNTKIYTEVNTFKHTEDITTSTLYKIFFADPKTGAAEPPLIETSGCLIYDKKTQEYKITTPEKLKNNELPTSIISLNNDNCTYNAVGKMDLQMIYDNLQIISYGSVLNYPDIDSSSFKMTLGVNYSKFPEEALKLIDFNASSVQYSEAMLENPVYLLALRSFMGEEEYQKHYGNDAGGKRTRRSELPKVLQQMFMFSQVPFQWNPTKKAFVSTGDLNLAVFNKEVVARVVKGNIVLDKSVNARQNKSKPKIYVYFEIDKDWYYFCYDGTSMKVGSTNTDFNEMITKITLKNTKLGIMLWKNDKSAGSKAVTEAEREKTKLLKTYFPKNEDE